MMTVFIRASNSKTNQKFRGCFRPKQGKNVDAAFSSAEYYKSIMVIVCFSLDIFDLSRRDNIL